ncbi:retrovirus-related pol polyprotein from transposon TNT 1-94 [Tanacetum coccineum]|uniref:Retrovirus-related pol polyprotein from transposon TNT 1-94 n=1 Tax=Tanacetum coccineum TaxID=301880 RepID=A0ABQ5C6G9_9ASTR
MKWVPKVRNENVKKKLSFAIDNASRITNIVQLILFIVDFGCTKHMTGNLKLLCNFVEKYLGTVRFDNDQFAPILGYGDLVQGNITINRVYYRSSWKRFTGRLSHLNFDYINLLSKKDVVIGLPKLKYVKDQLCSSCEVSKAKRISFKKKSVPSLKGRLNLLHMDLCGPMRAASINGKKYILTLDAFFKEEGIEHQTSTPRTPEQNDVVKRRNRTLVEAARTMLSASKLPFLPTLRERRPGALFDLGKFDGKADEGFFVGYSINSKAFRVFNSRTKIVEENLHVQFIENTPNIAGSTKACDDACKSRMKTVPGKDYILLPLWTTDPPFSQSSKNSPDAGFKPSGNDEKKVTEEPGKEGGDSSKDSECSDQEKEDNVNSTNTVNAASTNEVNVVGAKTSIELPDDPNMPEFEDIVYSDDDEDVGAEADMNNLDAFMPVSPIPTTRVHKDHPVKQIIGDLNSAPQTRRMTKNLEEHGLKLI